MNVQRIVAGGVIGGVVGLAIWYAQRALNVEFPLEPNVFRYVTFWLIGGVVGGVAATLLRR